MYRARTERPLRGTYTTLTCLRLASQQEEEPQEDKEEEEKQVGEAEAEVKREVIAGSSGRGDVASPARGLGALAGGKG